MIVVSDTSPLAALITAGAADLLPHLFQEVVIPAAVRDELPRSHSRLPSWLRVETVMNQVQLRQFSQIVDSGEAEAIELAKELHADRLLMDERKGRRLAAQEGPRQAKVRRNTSRPVSSRKMTSRRSPRFITCPTAP